MFEFEKEQPENKSELKCREGEYIIPAISTRNGQPIAYSANVAGNRKEIVAMVDIARRRNWTRKRLIGLISFIRIMKYTFISEIEAHKLERIKQEMEDAFTKDKWDEESVKFGLKPRKNEPRTKI